MFQTRVRGHDTGRGRPTGTVRAESAGAAGRAGPVAGEAGGTGESALDVLVWHRTRSSKSGTEYLGAAGHRAQDPVVLACSRAGRRRDATGVVEEAPVGTERPLLAPDRRTLSTYAAYLPQRSSNRRGYSRRRTTCSEFPRKLAQQITETDAPSSQFRHGVCADGLRPRIPAGVPWAAGGGQRPPLCAR